MTRGTGRRVRSEVIASVTLLAAGLALMLGGCASRAVGADPATAVTEPHGSAVASVGEAVSGTGPTETFPGVEFPVPEDARSVVVEFECAGGGPFWVELGDSMMLGQAPLSGTCDGKTRLAWPVTERTGSTLGVGVGEDVGWVATPTFSTEDFVYDPALTADCASFSEIYSALSNADIGLTHYQAFSEGDWSVRVDRAAADLADLATSAQSSLGPAFGELQGVVSDPGRTVGVALNDVAQGSLGVITAACNMNQTPLVVVAEFGG